MGYASNVRLFTTALWLLGTQSTYRISDHKASVGRKGVLAPKTILAWTDSALAYQASSAGTLALLGIDDIKNISRENDARGLILQEANDLKMILTSFKSDLGYLRRNPYSLVVEENVGRDLTIIEQIFDALAQHTAPEYVSGVSPELKISFAKFSAQAEHISGESGLRCAELESVYQSRAGQIRW